MCVGEAVLVCVRRQHARRLAVTVTLASGLVPIMDTTAALGLASQPAAVQAASTSAVRVAGRVVDATSGQPIPNAAVELVPVAERVDREGNAVWIVDSKEDSRPLSVRTSSDGIFELAARSGTYGLRARRQGYIPGGYGQVQAGAALRDVRLEAGRDLTNLTIRLWRLGVITGRVSDEKAEPVTNVRVRALRRTFAGAQARYAAESWVNTDDTGSYRLPELSPGEYLIAVTSTTIAAPVRTAEAVSQNNDEAEALARRLSQSGALLPVDGLAVGSQIVGWRGPPGGVGTRSLDNRLTFSVYQSTFYPSVSEISDAVTLSLHAGDQLGGIDITIRSIESVSVSGTIRGPDGPAEHVSLRMVALANEVLLDTLGFETSATMSDSAGRFVFLGVPPGEYAIVSLLSQRSWAPSPTSAASLIYAVPIGRDSFQLAPPSSDEPLLWARRTIQVGDTHLTDVAMTFTPGSRVTGRVRFESTTPPSLRESSSVSVHLVPITGSAQGRPAPISTAADGSFSTARYPPGPYRVVVGLPTSRWRLAAVLAGGTDVDAIDLGTQDYGGIEIVLTERETRLHGVVRVEPTHRYEPDSMVVVIPADVERWISMGMNPTRAWIVPITDGGFTIKNIKPDRYLVAVLPPGSAIDLTNPVVVRSLIQRAEVVTVRQGENRVAVTPRTPSEAR
jgi:Carboxypeptidase regulatory-like domain